MAKAVGNGLLESFSKMPILLHNVPSPFPPLSRKLGGGFLLGAWTSTAFQRYAALALDPSVG
jgi:hypothetical protein